MDKQDSSLAEAQKCLPRGLELKEMMLRILLHSTHLHSWRPQLLLLACFLSRLLLGHALDKVCQGLLLLPCGRQERRPHCRREARDHPRQGCFGRWEIQHPQLLPAV